MTAPNRVSGPNIEALAKDLAARAGKAIPSHGASPRTPNSSDLALPLVAPPLKSRHPKRRVRGGRSWLVFQVLLAAGIIVAAALIAFGRLWP